MQKDLTIRLRPEEAADPSRITREIAGLTGRNTAEVCGFFPLKQSIDARGSQPMIQLTLRCFINEPYREREKPSFRFPDVSRAGRSVHIIGAGPAGLFAALRLIESGVKPLIFERGKDVRSRRRDLALLNKNGIVNPESNYCFGEGGAGTYSDGKLYTRSGKRGEIDRILQLFVHFGADENILFESHPHIGTNKLPQIITRMRELIIGCGGEIHFEKKLTGLDIEKDRIRGITFGDGSRLAVEQLILATGHSARDIFYLLQQNGIRMEAKPFALGVRVEHPQTLINAARYHAAAGSAYLPPAAYSWVEQVEEKGVFSFCMCPGGIIAPAATAPGELVVNGWSPSKRNNPFANSGIVVTVDRLDAMRYFKREKKPVTDDEFSLLRFQQEIETRAFRAGGGRLRAPATRLADFTQGKLSGDLPPCSYLPGLNSADLNQVLPAFIAERLRAAFIRTGRRIRGYLTNEAVVVATESRTSSPVRIPRDAERLHHPQILNLFPCGEGAGYAGGIVSAAMDGENVVKTLIRTFT